MKVTTETLEIVSMLYGWNFKPVSTGHWTSCRWVATDEDGKVYMYGRKPYITGKVWAYSAGQSAFQIGNRELPIAEGHAESLIDLDNI